VSALASALEAVLDDPTRARELGLAARERVTAAFTWDAIAGRLAAYYEELLAGRATGRAA